MVPTMAASTEIPMMPSYFPGRTDFGSQPVLNPFRIPENLKVYPMGGSSSEEMIANCIFYGHMYQTSLMAVKVRLPQLI